MKRISRLLSFIVLTYVLATSVNIQPFIGSTGLRENTFVVFQLAIADDDFDAKTPLISSPPGHVVQNTAAYHSRSFNGTSHSKITVAARQFIRFRNLRI